MFLDTAASCTAKKSAVWLKEVPSVLLPDWGSQDVADIKLLHIHYLGGVNHMSVTCCMLTHTHTHSTGVRQPW